MHPTHSTTLGGRLRHRRKLMGLTLSAVARAAGCSESMISKIETDSVSPSLTMLRRVATALDTNVAKLFAETPSQGIVSREGERPRIDTDTLRRGDAISLERLIPYHDGTLLQANIHIVGPGGCSDGLITHVGEEMGYILAGVLELTVDGRAYLLNPGDSFHFASDLPHGYRNPGAAETRVLWVNTPPTF